MTHKIKVHEKLEKKLLKKKSLPSLAPLLSSDPPTLPPNPQYLGALSLFSVVS